MLFFYISSAGVGRTGVFLAVDTILDKLENGVINSIDVFGQVCAMRERRMNMIQTLVWIVKIYYCPWPYRANYESYFVGEMLFPSRVSK